MSEAESYISAALKALSKPWYPAPFWKPDWETAAQNYEKAAALYKNAKSHDKAIDTYVKAAEAQRLSDSPYLGAKNLDLAAQLAVQAKQFDKAAELYKQASQLFLLNNTPDRATETLEKGARAVEATDIDKCIALYMETCDMYEEQERQRLAVDTFKRTLAVLLKNKRYPEAVNILQRLYSIYSKLSQRPGQSKTALSLVIVLLGMGDEVEAGKSFEKFVDELGMVDEVKIASELLDAFDKRDQDAVEAAVKQQSMNFLDNEVIRLARSLRVMGSGPTITATPTVAPPKMSQPDLSRAALFSPTSISPTTPFPPSSTAAQTSQPAPAPSTAGSTPQIAGVPGVVTGPPPPVPVKSSHPSLAEDLEEGGFC
ncbi:hypothetical protein BKA69DRAFT_1124753 [Paraphysoderma sedebokerense]|nr:hypothetical protein BKA69DRAFT_1124753 [Paraphysoderma sedebokerense]